MAKQDKSGDGDKSSESKSLNEQNWPGLLAITALNLIVFAAVSAIDAAPYAKLAKAWGFLLPAGVGLAMIRVINGLINGKAKNRLVFWKWKNPLPGCEAYTVYAKNDDRYTEAEVLRIFHPDSDDPETLKDPNKQNAHFYKNIFLPMQNKPAVQQAERNFLFTRDYAAISFVMLVSLGVAGYFVITADHNWVLYSLGLIVQFLLARTAARNYGIETVTDSIAQAVNAKEHESTAPAAVPTDTLAGTTRWLVSVERQ
jgi:hypothetical protein